MQKSKQSPDQNNLAYLLTSEIQKTTEKFVKTHPYMSINGVMGAANVFMASLLCNAPSKEEALKTLDANFNIIRNIITDTPEQIFTTKINPNLN